MPEGNHSLYLSLPRSDGGYESDDLGLSSSDQENGGDLDDFRELITDWAEGNRLLILLLINLFKYVAFR